MFDQFQQITSIYEQESYTEASAREQLLRSFSRAEEYGLLNRLDTATSGLLYFARSHAFYTQFRSLQQAQKVEKYYLAQVWGEIGRNIKKLQQGDSEYGEQQGDDFLLCFPVMHHRHDPERMISCTYASDTEKFLRRGRGKLLLPKTLVSVCSYDSIDNTSIVRIQIHQGVRHQIRVHLATL